MSREKQGYHDTMRELNDMFPNQGMLKRSEVARFIGVHRTTIYDMGIQFNAKTGRVTKADLARQICI